MKNLLCIILLVLFTNEMHSQVGSLQWQYPRGGSLYDYVRELDYTSDGGSVTAGYTESSDADVSFNHSGGDCWLIKSSGTGALLWEKTFGGTGFDFGYSVKQTADGGYIYAGYSESTDGDVSFSHGGGDCWIVKLDNTGNIEWERTYGGTGTENAQCIVPTADGGYVFCGYTESTDGDVAGNHGGGDCWIVKLDNSGDIEWQRSAGGTNYDYAQDIKQTLDGGYVFTGGTNSSDGDVTKQNGNGDCWLVKLDAAGIITWESSFGGSDYDFAQGVEEAIGGGYILSGYTQSADLDVSGQHGNGDCWVVHCTVAGIMDWQKALGSSGNDYAFGLKAMSGLYVLTGYAENNDGDVSGNHGNYDCWVVLLDETGVLIAQRSFGGSGLDVGYSVNEANPGSFLIAGYTESSDGDISGYHAGGDCWIMKLSFSATGMNDGNQNVVSVYPNPGTGVFNFSGLENQSIIRIYDVSGRAVFNGKAGFENTIVDLSDFSKGIYYYEVAGAGSAATGKLIIQ